MKNIITYLVLFLVILYLLFAFVINDFNFTKWSEEARFGVAAIWACFTPLIVVFIKDHKK